MSFRKGLRKVVDWAFWPALVILALNVEELATEYGWNKLLVRNWSPAADSVLDLLQTRSLRYSATLVVGIAVGVWLDLLARKLDLQRSQQSSSDIQPQEESQAIRTLLRLRFSGHMEAPDVVAQENVRSWFAFWSPSSEATDHATGNSLISIPPAWAFFVTFEKPVPYHQLIVSFSGPRPPSYEVKQALPTSAVVTISGGMPACEMEIVTRSYSS